jgi:hypothetical protein
MSGSHTAPVLAVRRGSRSTTFGFAELCIAFGIDFFVGVA